jgi:hypothetical protein
MLLALKMLTASLIVGCQHGQQQQHKKNHRRLCSSFLNKEAILFIIFLFSG